MTDCPFCPGKLLITASKAGEEVYCTKCLSVIKSASLKFSYNATDLAGEVNECSDGGLPGFKGSGKKAKCHTFTPGDESGEARARQNAKQSTYTTQKRSHIEELVREAAFGGFDTTKVPEFATDNGQDHSERLGPSGEAPSEAVGTQISDDGTWDQNLINNVNNNSVSTAY